MTAKRCGKTLSMAGGAVLAFASCGGVTAPSDETAPPEARDAQASDAVASPSPGGVAGQGLEAAYLACFDGSGRLDASLKACHSDGDCLVEREQTDCCGTILYVGVNAMFAGSFAQCEKAWAAHFPVCQCTSSESLAEDGMSADGGGPQVRCAGTLPGEGVCMTYMR